MARTKGELLRERKERSSSEWMASHQKHIKSQTFRKYGGVPDSSGKVHDLGAKGKALSRAINSPKAKLKRSLRGDEHEGHANRFTRGELARLNRK